MESKVMDLVKAMHQKFGIENTTGANQLTVEEKEFRSAAMLEELNEYIAADTLVDQYDALLDLIVFAVGTLERHGFPLLAGFEKVMEANMAKELGQNGEKRGGFKRDLVKPEGWTPPEAKLQLILDSNTSPQVVFDFAKYVKAFPTESATIFTKFMFFNIFSIHPN
jgi:predicted HAD superfamily Cof-like phosphohydrolase